jgi:VWFA-related protein
MRSIDRVCLVAFSFLPVLFVPSAAYAQDQTPDSGAVIRAETRMVLVDTIVTDKKGNYVHSLTAKDFKVWEDNKEQAIKTFTVQSDPLSPAASQRRYIVLFFDNSSMETQLQVQARQAAAKFIDAVAAPNRMMSIVNYGGALQIAQNFTADAARLKRVVAGEKFASVSSNEDPSLGNTQFSKASANFAARDMLLALRGLAKDLGNVPGRKTLILFTSGFPLNAERISEATATIDACNHGNVAIYPIDVRGLASGAPPVAEITHPASSLLSRLAFGFSPASTGMSFFQRGGAPSGGAAGGATGGAGAAGGGRTASGSGPAAGAGAGAGVGRTAPTAPTAPSPGAGRGGAVPTGTNPRGMYGGPNAQSPFGLPSQARSVMIPKMPDSTIDGQNIMHMLADGTGGFVIKNTNDLFAGLQKIGLELDEYYILGYTPPESPEGSCHALKVKVEKGGAEVRARTGYCNAKSHDVLSGNPVEKTLESRVAGSQPGTVAAALQLPYFYKDTNVARVNVAMEIPAGVITFEKQKGKFHGEIDVLGIAYNQNGGVAARFSDTIKRDFEEKKQAEAFEQAPFHYENQFEIASGRYNFKLVFGAPGAAKFGKLEAPLNIDAWDASQFGISSIALSNQARPENQMAMTLDQSLLDDHVPLVASGVEVVPAGSNKFAKQKPPLFYAEVYEPLLLDNNRPKDQAVVAIQIRVLDRKSGDQKFSSGLMRLDNADIHGPVMAMGERIPIENVGAGQYSVELLAVDTTGHEMKRTADFDLE